MDILRATRSPMADLAETIGRIRCISRSVEGGGEPRIPLQSISIMTPTFSAGKFSSETRLVDNYDAVLQIHPTIKGPPIPRFATHQTQCVRKLSSFDS